MEPYQVIARKYRPQTFADVVGQEAIVTTLKNALRQQRLAHAYLFCGCRGTGKTTLARVFAKALNCKQLSENQEPCNTCSSCQEITSGHSLDVLEIDGASHRGIDDIRQINETIGYVPASGKFKVYIIDEVHMLTKEAFNALLKTLEEPPKNVLFFFATTEPHKVLPTIISRCQRFDLGRIPFEPMCRKLTQIVEDLKVASEPGAIELIAQLSEGSLRDAQSLLDQIICYAEPPLTVEKIGSTLGLMPRSTFFALDQAIANRHLGYAFELTRTLFSSGKDLTYFLEHLVEHFRTLLHFKCHAPDQDLNAQERQQYAQSIALYTQEQCLYILDYLIQWQQFLTKTPMKRVTLEMILLHLIRSKDRISLSTLTQRLIDLEKGIGTAPIPKEEISEQISKSTLNPISEDNIEEEITLKTTVSDSLSLENKEIFEEKSKDVAELVSESDTHNLKDPEPPIAIENGWQSAVLKEILEGDSFMSNPSENLDFQPNQNPEFEQSELAPVSNTQTALMTPSPQVSPLIQNQLVVEKRTELPPIKNVLLDKMREKIEEKQASAEFKKQIIAEAATYVIETQPELVAKDLPKQVDEVPMLKTVATSPSAQEIVEAVPVKATAPTTPSIDPNRYETLLRFAAVELEGVLKKE